jgi:tetratricopeptide (TPR) repeat protein
MALGRAADRFPTSGAVFGVLGTVWLRSAETGDSVALDKALAALERAATLPDAGAETHAALGRARALAGDLEAAERYLRRAVEQLPAPPEAYLHLAAVLERTGQWQESRDTLVQYATLEAGTPAVASAAPRIGTLSMRIGDPHAAAYWFEKAIAEGGVSTALLYRLAEAESDRGATARARELVAQGLALDPGHGGLRALAATLGVP